MSHIVHRLGRRGLAVAALVLGISACPRDTPPRPVADAGPPPGLSIAAGSEARSSRGAATGAPASASSSGDAGLRIAATPPSFARDFGRALSLAESKALTRAVVGPSLLRVSMADGGFATAFACAAPGLACTAKHVVGDRTKVPLRAFDGRTLDAPVVARVHITSGDFDAALVPVPGGAALDAVAMDDFIYGEPTVVPLPPAALLLGSSLLGLGLARRRRA